MHSLDFSKGLASIVTKGANEHGIGAMTFYNQREPELPVNGEIAYAWLLASSVIAGMFVIVYSLT